MAELDQITKRICAACSRQVDLGAGHTRTGWGRLRSLRPTRFICNDCADRRAIRTLIAIGVMLALGGLLAWLTGWPLR